MGNWEKYSEIVYERYVSRIAVGTTMPIFLTVSQRLKFKNKNMQKIIKTNLNLKLLLVSSVIIAMILLAGCIEKLEPKEEMVQMYTLTLHVKNWNDVPAEFVPIEVISINVTNSVSKRVEYGETDKSGLILFTLPKGKYEVQVPSEVTYEKGLVGSSTIYIDKDYETELKVYWITT